MSGSLNRRTARARAVQGQKQAQAMFTRLADATGVTYRALKALHESMDQLATAVAAIDPPIDPGACARLGAATSQVEDAHAAMRNVAAALAGIDAAIGDPSPATSMQQKA